MEQHNRLSQAELEAYRQAHEMRRRWEGYIWQYGPVAGALVALLVGLLAPSDADQARRLDLPSRLLLVALSIISGSIFLNVYRARSLMKAVELHLAQKHDLWRVRLALLPTELRPDLSRRQRAFSSTRLCVVAHFLFFLLVTFIAGYLWASPS